MTLDKMHFLDVMNTMSEFNHITSFYLQLERIIAWKGENKNYQHLHFPLYCQSPSLSGILKHCFSALFFQTIIEMRKENNDIFPFFTGKAAPGTPAYKSQEEYYDQILEYKKVSNNVFKL